MASTSKLTWGVVVVLFLLQPHGSGAAPALYIFGDSTSDCGNNNKLLTIARSNFPPYGRNFDSRHATGRFSNGLMSSDIISTFMQVPYVPAYLSPEADDNIFQGVNFASAGAGILNHTGDVLGEKISQWQQIELFLQRRNLLVKFLGQESAADHVRQAIYYFTIGGNDFIHNYVTNDTADALLSPDAFNALLLFNLRMQLEYAIRDSLRGGVLLPSLRFDFLSKPYVDIITKPVLDGVFMQHELSRQVEMLRQIPAVQTLYRAGARKMVVLGIGPIGCAPHFLFISNSTNGECLTGLNQLIVSYNSALAAMIRLFNRQNDGSLVIYRDIYNVVDQLSKNPTAYGFTVGNTACCGVGKYGGGDRCLTPAMVCDTPDSYVWWDEYHPSHRANHIIAAQIWSGTDPPIRDVFNGTMSFMTLQHLVAIDVGSL